jgi:hypothetical protein
MWVVSGVEGVPPHRRRRQAAYGVELGRHLVVVHAASGVTIVRVGAAELAFEADLAGEILGRPAVESST